MAGAAASGVSFLFYYMTAPILGWVVFPLLHLVQIWRPWPVRTAQCRYIASTGFAALMHWMSLVRLIDFQRRVDWKLPDGPFILLANHPTLLDAVWMTAVHRDLCIIAKPALFRNPLTGPIMWWCGHIQSGQTKSIMDGAVVISQCLKRLEQGAPILIFPEGRRSPKGSIGRLSRGAFEIASRANVPIVPVFLSSTPPVLCRGMAWYAIPKVRARLEATPLEMTQMSQWNHRTREAAAHYQELFTKRVRTKTAELC